MLKGFSISAAAIRVWLQGTLADEGEGLDGVSPESSVVFVCESRQVEGPAASSGGISELLSLGSAGLMSTEFGLKVDKQDTFLVGVATLLLNVMVVHFASTKLIVVSRRAVGLLLLLLGWIDPWQDKESLPEKLNEGFVVP